MGSYILVAEDDILNQEVAESILIDAGFFSDIANNGKIATDMIKKVSYDIVLKGMQMPVMDGVSAKKELRKIKEFCNLPIVAMTATAMSGD